MKKSQKMKTVLAVTIVTNGKVPAKTVRDYVRDGLPLGMVIGDHGVEITRVGIRPLDTDR